MPIARSLIRRLLALPAGARRPSAERSARAERIVLEQLDVACRTARRLGVPASEVDDVAQEVMLIVVRRLDAIDPDKERAFVAATSVRVAANWRRQRRRRHEQPSDELDSLELEREALLSRPPGDSAEHCLERTRKLQFLHAALESMTEPQRVAFMLFELEELTAREIAQQLHLPVAVVVSRARRAREAFASFCQHGGGGVMALEAAARHPERYRGVAALLPPRLTALPPALQQPGARLSRVLFVTLASERPDYYWPGKPLDPALLQDWELAVGLPRRNEGIPGSPGAHPPTLSIPLPGRPDHVQQFDFAAPTTGTAAVQVLVLPRGDELSVGAGGIAAPLDVAARAWEFLSGVGTSGP